MRRASLPVLELSTLLVVITGCVIAVVPGADDYVRHLLSGHNANRTTNLHLLAENDDPSRVAQPKNAYPERFASLKAVPITEPSDLLVIDDENKLPVPTQDALTSDDDDFHPDDFLMSLEPAAEAPDLPIIKDENETLPIAINEDNANVSLQPEEIGGTELSEQNKEVPATPSDNITQSENIIVGEIQIDEPAQSNQSAWTPNTTWNLSGSGTGSQVIRNPTFQNSYGTVKQSTANSKAHIIRNKFLEGPAGTIPKRNSETSEGQNWQFQQLPTFEPVWQKPVQRLPMSAETMQSDNSFQLPRSNRN